MACLAQLVNVIAPIMTENDGKAWAQTIFYPFMYASAFGRGTTLRTAIESDSYSSKEKWDVPYLCASVIHNEENREVIVFAANRSLEEEMDLNISLDDFGECKLIEHIELYSDDLKIINDKDAQRVTPVSLPVDGDVKLKNHSWNMLRYQY